jgi:hypothetical protein
MRFLRLWRGGLLLRRSEARSDAECRTQGGLRLRGWFASRNIHCAQDDKGVCEKLQSAARFNVPTSAFQAVQILDYN